MSDPPRTTPTFSFGAPATSGTNSSPFGQSSSANNGASNSLFGSKSATPATSTSNTFGGVGNTTGGVQQSSLFGSGGNTGSSGQGPSLFGGESKLSNAFGGGTGAGSTGFSFGQQPQGASSNGGFATPNKTSAPAELGQVQASNLFRGAGSTGGAGLFGAQGSNNSTSAPAGSTTPATQKPTGGFSFGNPSTTPAGPPPSSGPGTGSGGLFSFNKPQQQSGNLFGSQNTTQSSAGQTPPMSAPSNPFGDNTQTSSSLSGTSGPAEQSATPASNQTSGVFFGNNNASGGSNMFATAGNSQPSSGLFGNQNKPQESVSSALTGTASRTPAEKLGEMSQGQQPESSKPPNMFAGLGGPRSDSSNSAQSSSPSLFGGLGTGSSSTSTSKPAFSFPNSQPTTSQPSSATAPTSSSGSSSLFKAQAPAPPGQTNTAPPVNTPTPNLFGNLNPVAKSPATASSAPSSSSTNAPALTSLPSSNDPAPAGGLFGNLNAATTTGANASSAPTAGTSAPNTNLGNSTTGPTPPAQSRLKNKSMDEIITRWAADLSKYQKEFQSQAERVAAWDRMLVENGEKIQQLYASTFEAERASAEVERQLTAVEGQQDELSGWLDRYEREVDEIMSRQIGQGESLQGPDQERERTYKLAEKLSERLDEMGKDLTSMIEEINSASSTLSKTSRADDPVSTLLLSQIVRVLNSHLSQLQMIDQGAAALQAKVAAAQKAGQSLGPNGYQGMGNDAADDFYRSFMGKR
ncbi:MAG: FG-nucleoporin nsp1 [Pycnora praestabilis]|nr:MAG: FG-nucleoporin nsp1 [Pycnora praestabilis]